MRYYNCMASRRRSRVHATKATRQPPIALSFCIVRVAGQGGSPSTYIRARDRCWPDPERRRRYEQSLVVALPAVVHASAATVRARQPPGAFLLGRGRVFGTGSGGTEAALAAGERTGGQMLRCARSKVEGPSLFSRAMHSTGER
jgi:hypothetical protein